ncbi:glycosyltransferase, partial [Yersinia sp. 1252 StPb PI]|uniref:glycosyltransferase family 2 protein n=1 Tax=Yersinia sp. 1252 StPb PI TaxID=3117404 RepID=UPI003B27BBB9
FSGLRFKIEVRIGNLKPVTELNDVIDDLVLANTQLISSTSWRITAPMRYGIKLLKSAKKKVGVLVREVRSINYRLSLSLLIESIRKDGFSKTYRKVIKRCSGNTASRELITYQDYLRYEINRNATEVAKIAKSVEKDLKPKISIILPVYKTDLKFLKECIDSVFSQSYGEWELCICDDFSNSTEITAFLESYTTDPRFKFITNENNGHISDSSNKALQLATGRYVVLLDHDDLLHKYALHYIAGVITEHQDVDIIYTDEDHVTVDGVRKSPFFKPDWSPVLLYGQNYIGHITCISKKVIDEVGGFRLGLEGAQDYDLVLRASTKARRVVHIPRVLYHWREHPLSTAMNAESKPYAHDAGKQAVADFLRQKYPNNFVKVNDGDNLFTYEPEFSVNNIKKVSIIIPIRDKIELLIDLIQSIEKYTTWLQYEIIVIDNGSLELATSDYLNSLVEKGNCKVIRDDSKFNWSKLNNDGAKVATGDVLIFLNNDTLVITPKWIEYLVSWAVLPDVAVVGPQLLYEDGSLQHAGVVVGMSGWADHVFKGQSNAHSVGPFVSPAISRNVLALTGACHVIERQKFNLLGGYDELFEICGSDIELCIRAHKLGYSNVYLAQAKLYHLESKSRTSFVPDCDFKRSAQMYEPYRKQSCDPFYNVNLDMFNTQPSVKI